MSDQTAEYLKKHLSTLLSTQQASAILRISRRRVEQLCAERKLGLRIGRTLALTVKEVLYLHRRPKPGGDRRSVAFLKRANRRKQRLSHRISRLRNLKRGD